MRIQRAQYYVVQEKNIIKCQLCPRGCLIKNDECGFCKVRFNRGGILYSLSYGNPAEIKLSKIEKHSIYNFLPGSRTLAIGTFGCNFDCECCRKHILSKGAFNQTQRTRMMLPKEVADMAKYFDCKSITFTYNEPTVFTEYAIEIAKYAKKLNLAILLNTNGFINKIPRTDLYTIVDAAVFDLKSFSADFYRHHCLGSIGPVLDSIRYFYNLKKPMTINNLIVNGRNDSELELSRLLNWLENNLDRNVPLNFTPYRPSEPTADFRSANPDTIKHLAAIAACNGFHVINQQSQIMEKVL